MNSALVLLFAHAATRSITTDNGFTSIVSRSLLTRRNSWKDLAVKNLIPPNADAARTGRDGGSGSMHALKLGDVAAHRIRIRLGPRDDGITTLAPQTRSDRVRQIKFGTRVSDEKLGR